MSLLTILDRLSGFIYPIYLLRGQWTAWAMLVPLPKDQISDRWNEWNMKRGGTMWNGETCNLVHSSWLPARPQIAVRKHGSLPCVPGVPGVPRGLARLLSLVSLSLTPSVPQLRNCACQLFHGTSWTRIKQGSNNESWTIQTCHHWGSPFRSSHRYGKKRPSAFRSSRLNARFTWKRWKMKKNTFGTNT